jgi:hypothetical protein
MNLVDIAICRTSMPTTITVEPYSQHEATFLASIWTSNDQSSGNSSWNHKDIHFHFCYFTYTSPPYRRVRWLSYISPIILPTILRFFFLPIMVVLTITGTEKVLIKLASDELRSMSNWPFSEILDLHVADIRHWWDAGIEVDENSKHLQGMIRSRFVDNFV